MYLATRGRRVGRQAQMTPQQGSATDQMAGSTFSQVKSSASFRNWMRMIEMAVVLWSMS